jgi:UDP-N-acetylmuramoyl-tripeptide--D-alanyl-D-alanine ligase
VVTAAPFEIAIEELVEATGGELTTRDGRAIRGVSIDSRRIAKGDLYVAILGEHHDGHDFCDAAEGAGATALIVQRGRTPAHTHASCIEVDDTRVALGQLARAVRSRMPARVVGITGSAGKTTTKQLTAAALAAAGPVLATEGSLNNETGVPLTLLALRPQHQFAVIEMGMRGLGQIAYLRGLALPDVGVVVNAGIAHVGVVGSVEKIARGKSEIWLAPGPATQAIYPHGDDRLRQLAFERGIAVENHLSFGPEPGASVRVLEVVPRGPSGTTVTFDALGKRLSATLALPGRHNASNAACALAIAHALGVDLAAAARGLDSALPAVHRSQILDVGGRHVLDDCYNANPASMRAAIETIAELSGAARTAAVVGDMLELGDEAAVAHEEVGRLLGARGIGTVVAFGQYAGDVARGLAAAGGPAPLVTSDPAEAARAVAAATAVGDWILVKGSRGMKLERVLEALRGELRT